jgi:hypothetical protein
VTGMVPCLMFLCVKQERFICDLEMSVL